LVESFHWTLTEIYKTDIEQLLPFIGYYPYWSKRGKKRSTETTAACDEVNWL
jgi:hypothetical protein